LKQVVVASLHVPSLLHLSKVQPWPCGKTPMVLQTWPSAGQLPGPVQGVYLSAQKWPELLQICPGQQSAVVSHTRGCSMQTAGFCDLSQVQRGSPLCCAWQSVSELQPATVVLSPHLQAPIAAAKRRAAQRPRRAYDCDIMNTLRMDERANLPAPECQP
jgi:hypothetical protein